MLKEFRYRVKVSPKIKTVPRSQRVTPELKSGEKYYVSFGTNWTYPCFITEVVREFEQTEVKIKIQVTEKNAYFRQGGKMMYDPYIEHLVYAKEIGLTPEDAVRNAV
jgi:hypothetical protein